MCHLLLLLPFLLFDLSEDEIEQHNATNGTSLINPCHQLIAWVLHKINVKGPGANTNHRDTAGGTMMNHASRKETAKRLGQAIHGTYCVIFGSMI